MGYPEGALFLYKDDVIYSLRLRRRGFTMLFDPLIRFEQNCTTFSGNTKGILFWPLLGLLVLAEAR